MGEALPHITPMSASPDSTLLTSAFDAGFTKGRFFAKPVQSRGSGPYISVYAPERVRELVMELMAIRPLNRESARPWKVRTSFFSSAVSASVRYKVVACSLNQAYQKPDRLLCRAKASSCETTNV